MFVITKEISIRLTGCTVSIDECKNIDVFRYRWYALWRAHGITNNEDLALHILKHDRLGANDAKDKDRIQQACFP